MKNIKRKEQKQMGNKGFSLVELIVVIAIMAVLVAVLAPQFTRYVDKSRQSNDASTVAGIVNAVQAGIADVTTYDIKTGTYVIKLDDKGTTIADTEVAKAVTDTCGELTKLKVTANAWKTITITMDLKSDGTTNVTYASTGDVDFADYIGKDKTTPNP